MKAEASTRVARLDAPNVATITQRGADRRSVLKAIGNYTLLVASGGVFVGVVQAFAPRPPAGDGASGFVAGEVGTYRVDEVRYFPEHLAWVVRDLNGIYALSANCTHLGCAPRWLAFENKFKCPCHGSGFAVDGDNLEGPAPRPLERLRVDLGTDGQLIVDPRVRFRQERNEWSKPGAYMRISP